MVDSHLHSELGSLSFLTGVRRGWVSPPDATAGFAWDQGVGDLTDQLARLTFVEREGVYRWLSTAFHERLHWFQLLSSTAGEALFRSVMAVDEVENLLVAAAETRSLPLRTHLPSTADDLANELWNRTAWMRVVSSGDVKHFIGTPLLPTSVGYYASEPYTQLLEIPSAQDSISFSYLGSPEVPTSMPIGPSTLFESLAYHGELTYGATLAGLIEPEIVASHALLPRPLQYKFLEQLVLEAHPQIARYNPRGKLEAIAWLAANPMLPPDGGAPSRPPDGQMAPIKLSRLLRVLEAPELAGPLEALVDHGEQRLRDEWGYTTLSEQRTTSIAFASRELDRVAAASREEPSLGAEIVRSYYKARLRVLERQPASPSPSVTFVGLLSESDPPGDHLSPPVTITPRLRTMPSGAIARDRVLRFSAFGVPWILYLLASEVRRMALHDDQVRCPLKDEDVLCPRKTPICGTVTRLEGYRSTLRCSFELFVEELADPDGSMDLQEHLAFLRELELHSE